MAEFSTVASTDDLDTGSGMVVNADGTEIALFNIDGEFYAICNTCPHAGGPLGEGSVSDTTVTCPWHGSEFDLTSGEVQSQPAGESVPSYDVRVEDSEVQVRV